MSDIRTVQERAAEITDPRTGFVNPFHPAVAALDNAVYHFHHEPRVEVAVDGYLHRVRALRDAAAGLLADPTTSPQRAVIYEWFIDKYKLRAMQECLNGGGTWDDTWEPTVLQRAQADGDTTTMLERLAAADPTTSEPDPSTCRECGGQGWYVNRWGPDDNVEQVQCGCSFEAAPGPKEATE